MLTRCFIRSRARWLRVQECFRKDFGIPNLINGFGMTEIPGVHCNPFEGLQKAASLGPVGRHPDPARPWAQCRLVDDNGNDVGTDEVGELWVKHPIAMQGYFRDPGQTRAAFRGLTPRRTRLPNTF